MLIYFPTSGPCARPRTPPTTSTTCCTLRGAVVRDPHGWSNYLTETIDLFGAEVEVVFASHHWPTWGNDRWSGSSRVSATSTSTSTTRPCGWLNQGMVGPEIAEELTAASGAEQTWSARGYYGSVSHNVKAVYQRYLGWFDGNPAHLWEHPPMPGHAVRRGDRRR